MAMKDPDELVDLVPRFEGTIRLGTEIASYLLGALALLVVLHFHLLPTVFAGLTVHVLTIKLAGRLPMQNRGMEHKFALAALAIVVVLALFGIGVGLWSLLHGSQGMAAVLAVVAETLDNVRRSLPPDIAEAIPPTMEDLREQITDMLREHAHKISAAGMAGMRTLVHVIFGMVIGGMTALQHYDPPDCCPPLIGSLYARTAALASAFDKVVFAQVKISALNTILTALYLLVILPLCGLHVPMAQVLIPLTFVTGLLPVVGNLISNTVIVLISLSVSSGAAAASLVFLVGIHKLEYFFNARIVGGEVQATAWELLSAMLVMEAVFGAAGLIAAPVAYAWLKAELKAKNLI